MSVEIQLLRSKIYFLKAQITSYAESGHFTSLEAAALSAPLEEQILIIEEKIKELQAGEIEVIEAEALTPEKPEI